MDNRLPGIRLRPVPSRQLALALAALHLAVGGAIFAAPVAAAVKLLLLLLLVLHGACSKARYPGGVTEVSLEADGNAVLKESRMLKASLRPDTLITPWVILLRFDLQLRRRPLGVLICPDAISAAEMCRLRTLLRFAVAFKGEKGAAA